MPRVEEFFYSFYRSIIQFLTDPTDHKKPCEHKAQNTFTHVCKFCIYIYISLFLQVTRTTIKAWMSSNFGGIPPPTAELLALEHREIDVLSC